MLHWLQRTGAGRPIALMGGGTTRVGDPSGKDESRKILSVEDIEKNHPNVERLTVRKRLQMGQPACGSRGCFLPSCAAYNCGPCVSISLGDGSYVDRCT